MTTDRNDNAVPDGAQIDWEERLRLVIEGAADHAILTIDPDRLVTSWSPGAASAFGWTADEIVGRSADILFTPEDRAAGQPERETGVALRDGVSPDVRWHQRKGGGRVFLNGSMRPLHDARGRHIGFHKIARDETDRHRADEALRQSEARYRTLFDSIDEGFCVIELLYDPEGRPRDYRFVEANGAFERQSGLTDAIGRTMRDYAPEMEQHWFDTYDRVIRTGEPVRFTSHAEQLGRWFDVYAFTVGSPGANQLAAIFSDTTARVQAELALRGSEEFNRRILSSSTDCIKVLDLDGRLEFMSEGGMGVMEVDDFNTVRNARWPDFWKGEEHEKALAAIAAAKSGGTGRFQGFATTAKGSPRWWDVVVTQISGPEGRAEKILSISRDVTATKQAELELQQLNETLERRVQAAIADRDRAWTNSRDLLAVIDTAGVFRAVNPAWLTVLGWTDDELLGRPVFDFIDPAFEPVTQKALADAAAGPLPTVENRYRHKDGSVRWISWVAAPEGDMIYASGRDITPEKEAAAALEYTQEQLRQAQKMEAVGQLTGGIAHDFNNLLTGVIGSLDMMQRRIARGETDKIDRYITAAITSANRAAALTHRLLAFSRRQPLDPRPVNANKLITGMEELLRRSIGEQVRLEIVTAGGLWQTLCDPNELDSAILNLAINARDAMPGGGQLTIETCNAHLDNAYAAQQREVTPGQYVCICVTDTGTGMSADVIAKAFDPFFTTKPIGQGTGLGLSMIYGFARQSEGYAKIYSEQGEGTTVKLYLPRYHGEADHADDSAVELTEAHRAHAGEVVLVVEDETAVRDLVVDVLEELGYRGVEAVDGPSGLKLLQSDARFDLLVTDIGLPGLNGRQLADAARAHRPQLKVLFMTGYAENATIANGFLEPGMEMITKPFAIEALATRIRDMIENG